jgi:hypothetical protein
VLARTKGSQQRGKLLTTTHMFDTAKQHLSFSAASMPLERLRLDNRFIRKHFLIHEIHLWRNYALLL